MMAAGWMSTEKRSEHRDCIALAASFLPCLHNMCAILCVWMALKPLKYKKGVTSPSLAGSRSDMATKSSIPITSAESIPDS